MPFINTKVSIELSKEKEATLKSELGKAVSLLGKGEAWLMLEFEDNCRLWFRGENSEPMAMVQVALFGNATADSYEKFTKQVCAVISNELGISGENIYVKYEEVEHWGYNSFNF